MIVYKFSTRSIPLKSIYTQFNLCESDNIDYKIRNILDENFREGYIPVDYITMVSYVVYILNYDTY